MISYLPKHYLIIFHCRRGYLLIMASIIHPKKKKKTHAIDATGLAAIVTGASSGIGTDTTHVLALRGAL